MGRPINDAALKLIKDAEGFRSHPYWDPDGGVWTVGYGETKGVTSSAPILSEPEAASLLERRLENDYAPAVDAAASAGHVKLNDNQRGACVSLAYNVGTGYFGSGHTIGDALRRGDLKGVAQAFGLYIYSGGHTLPGLITRRAAERALFESRASSTSSDGLPKHKNNSRTLHAGDIGSDVRHFQGELNRRLGAINHPGIATDGQYGPSTEKAKHIVTYVLGFPTGVVHRDGATAKVQDYIDTPSHRPKSYLETAKKRRKVKPHPDPGGGVKSLRGVELIQKLAHVASVEFGLTVWQWLPGAVGNHAANSYHKQTFPGTNIGRAFDAYGQRMHDFAVWVDHNAPQVTEGIHNPGLSRKYGKPVPSSYWGPDVWAAHRLHVHIAV